MTKGITVADKFQNCPCTEELIEAISDGSFNVAVLKSYPATQELDAACREALKQMGNNCFDGRKTCAAIMSRAMEILRLRHGLDAPRGWLPVLKELRAQGGPATAEPTTPPNVFKPVRADIQPEDVITDPRSALHFFQERLKPYADLLVETVETQGVPQSWQEAVTFLDWANNTWHPYDKAALIAVRDEIQSRIPASASA
jgi:hypothetical protein